MGMMKADKRPVLDKFEPSRTQQHVADLASPKRLIEKYGSKRLREALNATPSLYSDVPTTVDYKEALDIISRGENSFAALPSGLRNRFENDPLKLLAFLNDGANRDEAIELGLIARPAVTDEAKRKDVKKPTDKPAKKDAESDDN